MCIPSDASGNALSKALSAASAFPRLLCRCFRAQPSTTLFFQPGNAFYSFTKCAREFLGMYQSLQKLSAGAGKRVEPFHLTKYLLMQLSSSLPRNLQFLHIDPPLGTRIPARCPGGYVASAIGGLRVLGIVRCAII